MKSDQAVARQRLRRQIDGQAQIGRRLARARAGRGSRGRSPSGRCRPSCRSVRRSAGRRSARSARRACRAGAAALRTCGPRPDCADWRCQITAPRRQRIALDAAQRHDRLEAQREAIAAQRLFEPRGPAEVGVHRGARAAVLGVHLGLVATRRSWPGGRRCRPAPWLRWPTPCAGRGARRRSTDGDAVALAAIDEGRGRSAPAEAVGEQCTSSAVHVAQDHRVLVATHAREMVASRAAATSGAG